MRTTLTVDDELSDHLTRLARETDQPFKVVVNMVIRRGLGELAPAAAPFTYEPHAGHLRAGIDPRRFNELASELEDEHFLAKQAVSGK